MTSQKIGATVDCSARMLYQNKITLNDESNRQFKVTYKMIALEAPTDVFVAVAECNGEIEGFCLGVEPVRAEYIFSLICEHGVMPGFISETIRDSGL